MNPIRYLARVRALDPVRVPNGVDMKCLAG